VEITIRCRRIGDDLVIRVRDNGIGIPKAYQREIFEKFFRVPTGNLHIVKGFGLGLSYVKMVIEAHGGLIQLQSDEGKGTEFIITLPQ
jgi:signal transduction histidine kinase